MNSIAGRALLIATLLVSGCSQEVAPRHQAATAVATVAANARVPQAPAPKTWVAPDEAVATVPQLATQLQEDADPKVRREALYLVADAGESDDVAVIGQALYDPDDGVRMAAVETLTGIGGESAADWMQIALGDPDPRIRRTAVEALGEIRGATAKMLLQQSLQDADASVRAAAQQILEEPEFEAEPAVR
jgi:HEAT repeat protein